MNADNTFLDSLSEKVLGAVFEVSNTLGAGFLEKVYQRALLRELSLRGIRATAETALAVVYKGIPWESISRISLSRTLWWWN
jgi:GxxExxY protein